ncbi:MAG TPA: hypothetical protein VGM37_16315 [Armatimonadota bacterium]|jgi:hypothetical protein
MRIVVAAVRRPLVGVVMAGLACCSLAGPPFQTDDPEPVNLHHWEAYIASQCLHDQGGVTYTSPHIEVNYGAARDLQLHVVAPIVASRPNGGSLERGYGDTELGVKYRFVHENAHRPQVGVFPLIEAPTGSRARGLGNGQLQVYLPVWLQKSWGPWTTYGGGGYWRNPGDGNRNWWFSGWLIQRDVSPHLTIGGEAIHTTPSTVDGRTSTGFNMGAIVNLDEERHILLSGGRDIRGERRTTAYIAYQWTFGPRRSRPSALRLTPDER